MPAVYAVVPAAGIGTRMNADRPKQYLQINNKTILEHTLERLLDFSQIEKIVVPVSSNDTYWSDIPLSKNPRIISCKGGAERYESVLNGLEQLLKNGAEEDAWVMVHDVARPCITQWDLDLLLKHAVPQGTILGMQVRDTMKRTDDCGAINSTVERENLWHALTPQVAPLMVLHDAIRASLKAGVAITDEASALEYTGLKPVMVPGRPSNIKVTRPEDLLLAEIFLKQENL